MNPDEKKDSEIDNPTRRFPGAEIRGLSSGTRPIRNAGEAMPRPRIVRVDRKREAADNSDEVAPLSHNGTQQPSAPLSELEIKRKQILETLQQQPLELTEATVEDIPRIMEIYEKLYLKREAFRDLATCDRKSLQGALKFNPKLLDIIRKADEASSTTLDETIRNVFASADNPKIDEYRGQYTSGPENFVNSIRLAFANKELSGGGELCHITRKEWEERIHHPGHRVLLMRLKGKEEIIGVNSYSIGPKASKEIREFFDKVKLDAGGQGWLEKRRRSAEPADPIDHLVMIHDTFFLPGFQGLGLFQRAYDAMIDFELHLPPERRVVTEDNQVHWAIWYFVNRFEEIWAEGGEHINPAIDFLGIKKNNATIIAGQKFGAEPIGITLSKDLSDGLLNVPSLEEDDGVYVRTSDGRLIWVKRGYFHMGVTFGDVQLNRR